MNEVDRVFPDFAYVREAEVELTAPPQLVPLYRHNRQMSSRLTVYPSGTAFPVWHAGGVFLITAAHCVQLAAEESLYCFYNGQRIKLDSEACEILLNSELDVAAIFLNDDRIVQLLCAVDALPVEEEDVSYEVDLLRVCGFPQSKNKDVGQADFRPSGVMLSVLPGDHPQVMSDIQHSHRIGLSMDPRTFVDDEGGRSFFLQKFEGLSGGPLIKFAERAGAVGGRVCGVFVEWDKQTRIGTAVKFSSLLSWLRAEVS